jgi:hypothetical protein
MVCEHQYRSFHPDLLKETFAKATFGNSIFAVIAGLVASVAVSWLGFVGPFIFAVFPLLLIVGFTSCWSENYGDTSMSLLTQLKHGLKTVISEEKVLTLGLASACFEGGMYIFVVLWVPALRPPAELTNGSATPEIASSQPGNEPNSDLSIGMVFAVFMTCMMIGSTLFELLGAQQTPRLLHLGAIASVALVVAFPAERFLVFAALCMLEMCVGLYFPTYGTLRSVHIAEDVRVTVMNLLRVPLNVVVVVVVSNGEALSLSTQWTIALTLFAVSFAAYGYFQRLVSY